MAKIPPKLSDFNPEEMVDVEQHKADIEGISDRLKKLEDKFGTNECIADTLAKVTERDTKMQRMLAEVVIKLISADSKVRGAITAYLNESDRNEVNEYIRKIGFAVWSILMIVIGTILQYVIQGFLSSSKP